MQFILNIPVLTNQRSKLLGGANQTGEVETVVTCDRLLLVSLADGFNRDNRVESLPFFKIGHRRQITYTPNASSYRATMTIVESIKEDLIVSPGQVVLNLAVEIRGYGMISLFLMALEG